MEDSRKKPLMIGIIITCIVLAVVITFATRSGDSGGIEKLEGKLWLKCNNPKCNAEYQIDQKEYYEFVDKNIKPFDMSDPPMTCKECGEQSAYKAIKCPNCGNVFYPGEAGKQFNDTCPKCNFSKTEDRQKKAAEKAAESLPGV